MARPLPTRAPSTRSPRPVFSQSSRSPSYLASHAQYSAPVSTNQPGIDSIVDAPAPSPKPYAPYTGVPSHGATAPHIVDSGISHGLTHANCQPDPGEEVSRIIATLFYKTTPRSTAVESRSPSPGSGSDDAGPKGAPTTSTEASPLEPPPEDEIEPLDHLYGSYVSPLCITAFLALLSSLPLPKGHSHITSSHRCLDVPSPSHPRVVELTFSPAPDPEYISLTELRKHELIYRFERAWHVDVVLQADTPLRRHPRLVVFDMDSTLITQEVIDLIAASIGAEEAVSAITARAMNGELDFEASLRERSRLLKGVSAGIFDELKPVLDITPGVVPLLRALKRLGVKTAVLSGGFIPLTGHLAEKLGIDHARANTLTIENGALTGELTGAIVDAEAKANHLLTLAEVEGVDLSQVVAVGDGANDLKMMAVAGLGVAWRAKPRVQVEAGARLNGESLLDLLFLFGFTRGEIGVLCGERA